MLEDLSVGLLLLYACNDGLGLNDRLLLNLHLEWHYKFCVTCAMVDLLLAWTRAGRYIDFIE